MKKSLGLVFVESFFAYTGKPEKSVKTTKYIGHLGRGKRNDDRNDRVYEPNTPFTSSSRMSKFIFEFSENVV